MVESFSQSSRVELSDSSQYGRKPKTSRFRPPGSTAAARSTGHRCGPLDDRAGRPARRPRRTARRPGRRCGAFAPSRSALPERRPAGRARGATPPTTQRSFARGLNGTVTRPPGANVVLSAAWAIASSYWTVGRTAPLAAVASASAAPTVAIGTIPTQDEQGGGGGDQSRTRGSAVCGQGGGRTSTRAASGFVRTPSLASGGRGVYGTMVPVRSSTGRSGAVRCGPVWSAVRQG